MAKRRTKKHKQRVKKRQLERVVTPEYKFEAKNKERKIVVPKIQNKEPTEGELVEKKLIVRDLIKSVVISVFILGLLALAYYRLN